MTSNAPIGVFDSGVGGLTVFRAVRRLLPRESILYVGDTARVPYGNKAAQTVIEYSTQIAQWLVKRGAKMLVVACNTSSAVALSALQESVDIPVVGMIEPGATAALQASHFRRIGVIGTARTIASAAYEDTIHRVDPKVTVVSQACPLLVSLVEEGWLDGPITKSIIQRYLEPIIASDVDTLIMGCTHYPLLVPALQETLGSSITLIDSGEAAAKAVVNVLTTNQLLAEPSHEPNWSCFVTDMPDSFIRVAHRFLDDPLPQIHHVHLE